MQWYISLSVDHTKMFFTTSTFNMKMTWKTTNGCSPSFIMRTNILANTATKMRQIITLLNKTGKLHICHVHSSHLGFLSAPRCTNCLDKTKCVIKEKWSHCNPVYLVSTTAVTNTK